MTPADFHAEFNRLTGSTLRLNYIREAAWHEFIRQGFTVDDLRLVIRWIKSQIADPQQNGFSELSLQFSTFSADVWSRFEERLQLAQKVFRPRPAPAAVTQTRTTISGGQVNRIDHHDRNAKAEPMPISAETEKFMAEYRRRKELLEKTSVRNPLP